MKKKTLWLAIVVHEIVPGSKDYLYFQEEEPTDEEVIARAAADNGGNGDELSVDDVINLSYAFQSKANRETFVAAIRDPNFLSEYMHVATPPSSVETAKTAPMNDGMKARFYEVYGYYAQDPQFLHATYDRLQDALDCVKRNPGDDLTVVKVLSDGTRTTEY